MNFTETRIKYNETNSNQLYISSNGAVLKWIIEVEMQILNLIPKINDGNVLYDMYF